MGTGGDPAETFVDFSIKYTSTPADSEIKYIRKELKDIARSIEWLEDLPNESRGEISLADYDICNQYLTKDNSPLKGKITLKVNK